MFEKLLIANRGEIACRIIKTCCTMGISSVAVYSQADAGARHVRLADEAVLIGPPEAALSYLNGAAILAAAVRTGAQAIHPGYGFLSENADFAEACALAGFVFIGPPPAAIRAMGSKSAAKARMAAAGVPLVPGYHGSEQDAAFLSGEAAKLGYPVLIKASAGGGGKGMRIVQDPQQFDENLHACQREAQKSFGDDRVLIERYVLNPRHIEMQIFADTQGNVVHLFERDCSVQRRHQKVLEEAPAPGLSQEARTRMGAAACAAARSVDYVGAGTVEFIVSPDGAFHFMEMNTRLQVEHPVTEMITGLDLVAWQLIVASGLPLPLAQAAITMRGHAIEARIYAEDADNGFLPSTGTIVHFATPLEEPHVRIDSGVAAGDAVSPYYDPMLAKLIVSAPTRAAACAGMLAALAKFHIAGVTTNIGFLHRLVASASFATADLDTALIEREQLALFPAWRAPSNMVFLAMTMVELVLETGERVSPWQAQDGWRIGATQPRSFGWRVRHVEKTVAATARPDGTWRLLVEGVETEASATRLDAQSARLVLDGHAIAVTFAVENKRRWLFIGDESHALEALPPLRWESAAQGSVGGLKAPMPGKIIALLAKLGEKVEINTPLLIMEAMKMEHTIRAPSKGSVGRFLYNVGDQVAEGVELVEFELG